MRKIVLLYGIAMAVLLGLLKFVVGIIIALVSAGVLRKRDVLP